MKQFKAITVDGEMALKRLPEMEAPEVKNNDYFLAYGHIKKYDQHLEAIESEPIIKVAPGYKDFWKEGDLVREDEFEVLCGFYQRGVDFQQICSRCGGNCISKIVEPKSLMKQIDRWLNEIKERISFYNEQEPPKKYKLVEIDGVKYVPKPKEDEGENECRKEIHALACEYYKYPVKFIEELKQHYLITKKTITP